MKMLFKVAPLALVLAMQFAGVAQAQQRYTIWGPYTGTPVVTSPRG